MSKAKKGGKKPVVIAHPNELKTKKQRDAFVDKHVDTAIDAINEHRRANGLPPLK